MQAAYTISTVVIKPCLSLRTASAWCRYHTPCYSAPLPVTTGSHTGDRKLDDNAWNWWPVSSTCSRLVVVYGQVWWSTTVKFGSVTSVRLW